MPRYGPIWVEIAQQRLVNEVLIFDGSLVAQGHGTYLGSGANPAGVTCR